MDILFPMLGMIAWSGLVLLILLCQRIPAVIKNWGGLQSAMHSDELRPNLPHRMRYVTDNYNHLFEQPTLFYAVVIYIYLSGHSDQANIILAWAYVALRVIHSLIQITVNNVSWRAAVFAVSAFCLLGMIAREVAKVLLT